MKISNVIRVASVLVAVAATGLAIYTKVKTEQVKSDKNVDADIKGETIVRNEKVMKAAVIMAATAGVVFLSIPSTKATNAFKTRVESFGQELAEHLNVGVCSIRTNMIDVMPSLQKHGLDKSITNYSTAFEIDDIMDKKTDAAYEAVIAKCSDAKKEIDTLCNLISATMFAGGVAYAADELDALIGIFTDGRGLV